MLRNIYMIIIIFMIVTSNAYSAPFISGASGSTISGSTMSIKGINFGLKTVAKPIKWDNFENGSDGAIVAGWDTIIGNNTRYSSANNRVGSKMCYAAKVTTSDNAYSSNSRISMDGEILSDKVFASYWIRFNWGQCDGQIKHGLRISNNYPAVSEPRFDTCVWYSQKNPYWQGANGYLDSRTLWGANNMYPTDVWVQVEVQAQQSNVNIANGTLMSWVGKASGPMVKVVDRQGNIPMRSTDSEWHQAMLMTWAGNTTNGKTTTIYYDDFYCDNTWARVVIGDSSIYDDCSAREVQIPTAWNDNSIIVTVNQGAYTSGQIVYLYVIDANGNHSNGYQLKIGVNGDMIPPSSPTGIEATIMQ